MSQQSFKQFIPFLLIALSVAISSTALARDIGVEQRAASAARDDKPNRNSCGGRLSGHNRRKISGQGNCNSNSD